MYVVDSNILIDYQGVDLEILTLVDQHLGPVLVPTLLVEEEVIGLEISDCARVGIECVEPPIAHVAFAAAPHPKLSFYDLLCFALARDRGARCVTNDASLGQHCLDNEVETLRGLRLMLDLVELRQLPRSRATGVATEICQSNPYLGRKVLDAFLVELEDLKE